MPEIKESPIDQPHQNGEDRVATSPIPLERKTAAHVPPPEPANRVPFYRKKAFRVFFLIVLLVSLAGTLYWLHVRNFEETDDAFIDGHVIPISPQISALVEKVAVTDNQPVRKGDLLVELDPTDYRIALAQAQGAEASAKGKLQQAQSAVPAAHSSVNEAQAALDSAQVSFDNADRQLQRFKGLDERAKSQQQLDDATAAQKTAAAQVEQARAKLTSAQTQVSYAEATVVAAQGDFEKAQADTGRAQINLGYCRIVAPADGRITSKNVDPGMYVTSASQFFVLIPSDVWIIANFKETQLDLMRTGQPVTIHVDAYPGTDFRGTVQSIQAGTGSRFSVIPSENATGNFVKVVQRVPVKITFDRETNDDTARLLSPGMSVEPKVRIRDGWF